MHCCYLFYFIRFLFFTVCLLYVIVRMNIYVMFLLRQRRLNKLIIMASIDKCFFVTVSPGFSRGHIYRRCSQYHSKIFQHSVAVLLFSVLFQAIFAKYMSLCPYIFLCENISCTVFLDLCYRSGCLSTTISQQ